MPRHLMQPTRSAPFVTAEARQPSRGPLQFTRIATAVHIAVIGGLLTTWQPTAQAQTVAPATAPSQPASATRAYDIPAGPLGEVLARFARESGALMAATPALVQGQTSPGARGSFSPQTALDTLLAGTGLQAVANTRGQFVLQETTQAAADAVELSAIVVTTRRANRVSTGATGLPLTIKDTPQTISTIDANEMRDFGVTSSNEALALGTGINIDQYETNRATFNSRGFEIQLTQVDGLGMTNDWGTIVGQMDTFMFDKIELIRGANGLLTGVGNASGTINYVRKRPTNENGGEVQLTTGSHGLASGAIDYNRILSEDGAWAGRLVVAHEDKDSYLRALHDKRTTVYGVVDGQIGDDGILTLGFTHQDAKQDSPMWGSLTLNYLDGTQAEFGRSSSTSQDWTYWNTRTNSAFIEYAHDLGAGWEAKATYTKRRAQEATALLYAYAPLGGLNPDNTGLVGWPYRSHTTTDNDLLDANVSGTFNAFGRAHSLIAGVSHSRQKTTTDTYEYDTATYQFLPLPAFPYAGNVYPEPQWYPRSPSTGGEQKLTRLYAASRLALSEELKAIVGVNVIRLEREGSSRYGSIVTPTHYPDTKETSPYLGLTYDFTPNVLGYASYSDIFQNQDQNDIDGEYLAPAKGVNYELGVKANWLDDRLLTTFAVFSAEQRGLATYAGMNSSNQYYYVPKDVKSKGFEFEATGMVSDDTQLTVGLTRLLLTGPDGRGIYEWVPRTTVNFKLDTRVAALPDLRLGIGGRWQSDVRKDGGAKQDAYLVAHAFAAYRLTDDATLRLNVNNLFDKKYVGGLAYGAIYGAPRNASITLEYRL
ncbi:MAG: TonB-dependent siderophore receptor [Rhodocyclaceae bacterium]